MQPFKVCISRSTKIMELIALRAPWVNIVNGLNRVSRVGIVNGVTKMNRKLSE